MQKRVYRGKERAPGEEVERGWSMKKSMLVYVRGGDGKRERERAQERERDREKGKGEERERDEREKREGEGQREKGGAGTELTRNGEFPSHKNKISPL